VLSPRQRKQLRDSRQRECGRLPAFQNCRRDIRLIGLWAIFTIMLFVVEPLFLHAWFDARAQRDPDGAFRVASRGHRILSLLAVVTVLGAVGGTHGLF